MSTHSVSVLPQVALSLENIPVQLQICDNWVCWRYITRDGKQTKCPIEARSGEWADATNPATWSNFDTAVAAFRNHRHAGVGFVFAAGGRFTGIDLDECIDESGVLAPSAKEVIASLDSYAEISPSGRGVKVIVAGRKPKGVGCKSKAVQGFKAIEVYDQSRFFTLTGSIIPGSRGYVEDRQGAIDALCCRLWPTKPLPQISGSVTSPQFSGDDDALIAKACSATHGDRFRRLFDGDVSGHGDDRSAADMALCNQLAFWCGKDKARMDRIFRRSALFREKWDLKRGESTYGQRTIDKAIADCGETYKPGRCNHG